MRYSFILAGLTALTAATPVAVEQRRADTPDPATVYVDKVTWAGTGCPPGSVSSDIGESATLVSLSFSKYVAQTGAGTSPSDARKNCDVRITLHYPQGWSYTVASTDFRGYARIPAGCSARLGANYFFSGEQNDVSAMESFNGPRDTNYRLTTTIPHDSLVWSKCGVTGPLFNVNSQAIITCNKDAFLGVDTQDTKFELKLHLEWEKCK